MLAVNGDGKVDQEEFMQMMSFLRASSPQGQQVSTQTSGIGIVLLYYPTFIHSLLLSARVAFALFWAIERLDL